MIRPGDTVGGYEILSKLSAGGMATLFLGRRGGAAGFRKHVAIKVVHEHLAEDATFVQMFVDEALLSSRIEHPNVVHIEELRELDGQHFLVMEYVSGVALSQLMRRLSRLKRRLTPELAAYIAIQVADGLHAAHELKDESGELEGVVHRDVSPQNVLLAWEGHVKLIDFGVAKARSRIQQTTGASLKGKLRYMAPEQARGAEVDRRTDVYALGILLWEMLTMRKRFHGPNDFALLDKVRNPEAIAPSEFNPAVSPELDAVVMRALAVSMDERYASAQEFRRGLAASLPQALALDASHLSDLVRAACTEELEKARERLPSSMHLPSEIRVAEQGETKPLQAMTVSVALEHVDDGPCSSVFTPSSAIASGPAGSSRDGTPHTA
ncbi:MAG: serine/threonine protein kinase, partial [Deltaproteobacteria bacterium]|nr:serine/threonine protein kinase [Deltaproteobacteria bacterium]